MVNNQDVSKRHVLVTKRRIKNHFIKLDPFFRTGNLRPCVICMRLSQLLKLWFSWTQEGKWTGSRGKWWKRTSQFLLWYVIFYKVIKYILIFVYCFFVFLWTSFKSSNTRYWPHLHALKKSARHPKFLAPCRDYIWEVVSASLKFWAPVPYYVWDRYVYMSKTGSAVP